MMSPCDIAATIHLYKILFVHNCFFDVERRHLRLIQTALGLMIMAGNIFSKTVLTPVSRVAVVARARLHSGSGQTTQHYCLVEGLLEFRNNFLNMQRRAHL